jgi:glycerol-3-phosphate O-acyltransferase
MHLPETCGRATQQVMADAPQHETAHEPPTDLLAPDEAPRRLTEAFGLLRWPLSWAFGPVELPEGHAERMRALAERGTIVWVGRSAAFVTFLYFQFMAVRFGLPVAQAVAGLAGHPRAPWARLFAGRRAVRAPLGDDVDTAVRAGFGATVFLRKPGSLVASVLGLKDPFPDLVRAQRASSRPLFLVPQLLIWERRASSTHRSLLDVLFGDPEAPGLLRSLLSLVWNRQRAFVKCGEPIDLQRFMAEHEGEDDERIARKVRGALSQHLARQARVVTGPRLKPAERLLEETLRDRDLRATLTEVARERGRADGSVDKEALRAAREIAARYSPSTVELVKWGLDLVFERLFDGIEVDRSGIERVRTAAEQTPLVLCPSHKSHVDYLVLSHAFYTSGLIPPHIAAGVNLDFWPVGPIFRKCGAFFIRRSFKGDKVYAAVLKAYVRKLLKDGFSQEFFIEGGRSRTGKVLLPKFGMLAMEVDAWVDGVRPDIAFVPAAIGYERVVEAESYARELGGGEKKTEDLGALLRAPAVLTSRHGRVYVRFDAPLSLAALAAERGFRREAHSEDEKRGLVRALGFRIVHGINRASALTPSGLLCTALLAHDRRGLTATDLTRRMTFLASLAEASGGAASFRVDEEGAVDPLGRGPVGEARALLEREKQLVLQSDGGEQVLHVPENARLSLDYQKNTALHLFVADALLATALLTSEDASTQAVRARTLLLSRLFKHEFIYDAGDFEALFVKSVAKLAHLGVLATDGERLVPADGGREQLQLLADLLVPFVEGYVHAAEALLSLQKPADRREFVKQALAKGQAAFLTGRLRRPESRSKVMCENALAYFEDDGVLVSTGRQLARAPAYAAREALDARVAAIRSFLVSPSS